MDVYVKTQAELDAIPLDTKDDIYIDFGTKENAAMVREQCRFPVKIINKSVVVTYNDSEVYACDKSIVYVSGNSKVTAYNQSEIRYCNGNTVIARDNSMVLAWGNSKVDAYDNSSIDASDNNIVRAYGNSRVDASINSTVYAHENSKVCAFGNSQVYAYDNAEVCAWDDKCIVSINDNAVVTSPSTLCSGAELLSQCNGNVGNVKFAVSNVPDEKKGSVFDEFYETNGRAFILTMRGIPYCCVYNFDTVSVKFYTMDSYCELESVSGNTILSHYIDNVLMPVLVNAKFDKAAKSNII